uniref:accessory Sec system translocase SecA2 n=1 Tax=Streptococcus pluranimalium TaxID=82348 RepID=UPI003F68E1E6
MTDIKQFFSLDYHRIKKLSKILKKVNNYQAKIEGLTDDDLSNKTIEFKERIQKGETLDDLLPEAYAVVREASKRVLGMFPYDVQVLGAIILHQGNVAEMKTGEGKTLTATMPLYLNALTGKTTILVTVNDYLALRDAEEMSPLYHFLGLTVGVSVPKDSKDDLTADDKRLIYASDIIYTTNSILGFDYLIDNLATKSDGKFMPSLDFAIVDEADAVLLDTAQTPLIISGAPRVQSNLYKMLNNIILMLKESEDYYYDWELKEVWITNKGIDEVERLLNVEQLFSRENAQIVRHLTLALKAHVLFENAKDYVIDDGEVKLLDKANGRILEGTRFQGGEHQAIEMKEGVKLTEEMRSVASVTYQNLFRMFGKLSGMTGTGKTVEEEMIKTYNMEVIKVPTHRPVIRVDYPDTIYTTLHEKIIAVIDYVRQIYSTGQPILLVSGSVRMSELYSEYLIAEGIPHSLLNAQTAVKEANMIAEAGQVGSVTVATNMAGRGTDIKLTQEAKELGGLAVIGTERMLNERMDLQMRGRAGRQGDPGMSKFFVSLEDDLIIQFGDQKTLDYFNRKKHNVRIESPKSLNSARFRRIVKRSQEASESQSRSSRDMTLAFDASVDIQRKLVYETRNKIIENKYQTVALDDLIDEALTLFLNRTSDLDQLSLTRFILENITYNFSSIDTDLDFSNKDEIKTYLKKLINPIIDEKKSFLKHDFNSFFQIVLLKAIDESWIEEVDYLQQLRILASSRSSAQRNPIFEYHRDALASYQLMKEEVRLLSLHYLLMNEITYQENGKFSIYFI